MTAARRGEMRSSASRSRRRERNPLMGTADLNSVREADRSDSSKRFGRDGACLAQRPAAALETAWRQRRPVRVRCWQRGKSLVELELMDCSFMLILSCEIFAWSDFKSYLRFLVRETHTPRHF